MISIIIQIDNSFRRINIHKITDFWLNLTKEKQHIQRKYNPKFEFDVCMVAFHLLRNRIMLLKEYWNYKSELYEEKKKQYTVCQIVEIILLKKDFYCFIYRNDINFNRSLMNASLHSSNTKLM